MTETAPRRATLFTFLALLVALAAVAGSLYLSLGMNLAACAFCFYERAFVMAALGVLLAGLFGGVAPGSRLSLLALCPAVAGLGVAGWHVVLEASGKMECPAGVLGVGTAPQQSLFAFVLLAVFLIVDVIWGASAMPGSATLGMLASLAFGLAFAYGSAKSVTPVKLPSSMLTSEKITICRPPRAQ
jgi:disulfide bond formation protein DsbB